MTENLAGRGEGLAGLVAKWRDLYANAGAKRAGDNIRRAAMEHCATELETALEAAAPAGTAPRPYRALNEGGGCKECHHGDDWTVVYTPTDGSEEIGEGESWDNESPADEMAESLNDAFERGWRAALANTFSTTSAREQSSATAASSPSTVSLVSWARIVIQQLLTGIVFTPETKQNKPLMEFVEDAHEFMHETVPAATQEQPAGSGASDGPFTVPDSLPGHAMAHQGHWVRDMQSGSPRKVGEDGAHCNAPNPDGSYLCNKEAGHSGYHVHSFINPDGENDFYMWVPRPSSVPVGEQKQEEGV